MSKGEKEAAAGSVDKDTGAGNMPPTYDEAKGLSEEDVKVKITTNDAKIEMGKEKEAQDEGFKGLTKDELMHYANDPFWVRLRWSLFILFWIIWVAMLVVSVVIIIYAPKCPSPPPKQWWQKGPVYKVEVADFPDTDGDQIGDLKGVEEKVNFLVNAGVGTAYFANLLSPTNFEEVNHDYGTMDDWASLARALQERGIRVMVDFQPGQTSATHMWYEEAVSDHATYKDFYLADTQQLNLENTAVGDELEKVIQFWLKHGVDGFMIQGAGTVPPALMARFRAVLDAEEVETEVPKVMVAEDDWSLAGGDYTGVGAGEPLHLAISEDLLGEEEPTAEGIKLKLDTFFLDTLPCNVVEEGVKDCVWPAFGFSTTAHGEKYVDALTMLKMLLPGTVITQPGEAFGLDKVDWTPPEDGARNSHLDLYSLLTAKLRHQDAILFGKFDNETSFVKDETVFGLTRVKKGSPGYVLLINLGLTTKTVDLSKEATIPESIRVLEGGDPITMAVSPQTPGEEGEEVKRFEANAVEVIAGQAKIFNFVPKFG